MKGRILVVDDDRDISGLVRLYLENEGFEVDLALTGEQGLAMLSGAQAEAQAEAEARAAAGSAAAAVAGTGAGSGASAGRRYDMLILDIMLPGMDGFEVARLARTCTDAPILMLSARDADVDKAVGLGVGADDYLTKPFSPVELVARVKAHLRRYCAFTAAAAAADARGAAPGSIEAGPVRLDLRARRAWVRGEEVRLTATEFDLLKVFVTNAGQVFTKAQLFDMVWGEDFLGADNTVTVHISRLRTKIEADPDEPRLIKTVWGIGYRFEPQGEETASEGVRRE